MAPGKNRTAEASIADAVNERRLVDLVRNLKTPR